jgi:hypothetical protein
MSRWRSTAVSLMLVATSVLMGACYNHELPTSLQDFDLTAGQILAIETTAAEAARTTLLGPKSEVWAVQSYRHLAVALVLHDFGHSIIWVQRQSPGEYISRRVRASGRTNGGGVPVRPRPAPWRSQSFSVENQMAWGIDPGARLHLVYGFLWDYRVASVEVVYDDGHSSGRVPVQGYGYVILRPRRPGEHFSAAEVRFYCRRGRLMGSVAGFPF